MNEKKDNYELNGINTDTAFDSMRNLPERAKVTFLQNHNGMVVLAWQNTGLDGQENHPMIINPLQ
jgi:hypothetical protein